ncbi:MAG: alpha/beta hydrolase [Actinobacteria bacterium]|nr:alpha/beta hydrolase [Actinomycetota bacterium]
MRVNRLLLRPIATAAVTALLVTTGCSSSGGTITRADATESPIETGGDSNEHGSLRWGECDPDDIAVDDTVFRAAEAAGLQCASLEVPVDHAKPEGETIEIALGRYRAAQRADRIGSLVVNPGGPGGSGLEFLANAGMLLPAALTDRFDIVSFDPRGLAASEDLECFTEDERESWITSDPDYDEGDPVAVQQEATRFETELLDGCRDDDAELLANIGTSSVIDDLDAIREAIGDEQLSFLGMSYGTRIGAGYATRYPDRVRAIALDSPVTPSRSIAELTVGQSQGIAAAIAEFIAWCDADTTCPAGPDTAATIKTVAQQLDATPIAADPDTGVDSLDADTFSTAVITAMYDPSYSGPLAEALTSLDADSLQRNDAVTFLAGLAGMQHSRKPDGGYGNGFELQSLVNCADADAPLPQEQAATIADPVRAYFTDEPTAVAGACTIIPTGDQLPIEATSAADRMLVIGTVGDPATPYPWMAEMADALGVTKRITYRGSGHAVSLTNQCVAPQLATFFTAPTDFAPADCERNPDERDIYALFSTQFATLGLPASVTACIVEELRATVSPLALAAANSSPETSDVVGEISGIALRCR